jgi:hypothetical protein
MCVLLDLVEDLFKVLVEARILWDHQVVFKDSFDEVLPMKKIFKLLEVNRILGSLRLECVDKCLQLVMRVDSTMLDMAKDFMLVEISSVFRV